MLQKIITFPAQLFLGKGFDKKMPCLVSFYKKAFSLMVKDEEIEVKIPNGQKLLVSNKDSGLGLFLRLKKKYEPLQTKYFLSSLKKGFTVFDIGANVGYYTILASKKVGRLGKVYAFEPDPRSLKLLQKNVALNKCKNVVIVNKAISQKKGLEQFFLDKANPGESKIGIENSKLRIQNAKQIFVKTTTLDEFVKERKITKIDVIKMDIEGAEEKALRGGAKTLKKAEKITLFMEHKKNKELIKILIDFGFKLKIILNEFEKKVILFTEENLDKSLKKVSYLSLMAEKKYE